MFKSTAQISKHSRHRHRRRRRRRRRRRKRDWRVHSKMAHCRLVVATALKTGQLRSSSESNFHEKIKDLMWHHRKKSIGVPAGTLRLPWLMFFRAFSSVLGQMPLKPANMGHGPHSSKIFVLVHVLFVLSRSAYCVCVNVHCTTATGWLPNCS